jgi:glycerophosphoryl diester phosphodiesterase
MISSMATLRERLLSHRLRGFSAFEGSLSALRAALADAVPWIEIDTRMTGDKIVLVFHDSRLERLTHEVGPVADYRVEGGGLPRYRNSSNECVPMLDEFLREFAARRDSTRLMLDIKDAGSEELHCRAVARAGLDDVVWIISWSPQILRRVHHIAPHIRLGFSHVPLTRWRSLCRAVIPIIGRGRVVRQAGRLLARLGVDRDLQDVVLYLDEYNSPTDPFEGVAGGYPIHFASAAPTGEIAEILLRTNGGVGTPAMMLTPEYVKDVHRAGLSVFVYSFDTFAAARDAMARTDVDIIFTNNPRVLSEAGRCE